MDRSPDAFTLFLLVFGLGTLAIAVFFLREVALWFWRVNDVIKRLDRIAESNERIADALTPMQPPPGSPQPSSPAPGRSAPGAPGPFPGQT